ncbi:helix-turn-helix domain-containing protein [Desulfatibacillum alkenivorans]|uniref:helix-turn-helix domain-containing protein n=1 Tax=Desulfatibacillum alkenivorans TaxID=259354 RepID=UPI0009357933|nr:helix-turn-helix domain-containing protein [Desulfatibacillum alkenivorans]
MKHENAILTPEQVAEELSIGVETVRHLMRQKKLPGVKVGGSWRTTKRAIYGYLEDQMGLESGVRTERGKGKGKRILSAKNPGKGMGKDRKRTQEREPPKVFFDR